MVIASTFELVVTVHQSVLLLTGEMRCFLFRLKVEVLFLKR